MKRKNSKHFELSRDLALAIGWTEYTENYSFDHCIFVKWRSIDGVKDPKKFDYMDWNVIIPIAQWMGMVLDTKNCIAWSGTNSIGMYGTTIQEAIAKEAIRRNS